MYMHVIWVWPMSHFVTFYVKVNFCTNIYHNLNCCFPFVVVELYKWTERFCELIISIWSLILCFEKGVGWRGCGNKDSHANSPAKLKLMLIFKRKIIDGISLKVRLFYNIYRENIFSKYTRVAMSDSSRIFCSTLLLCQKAQAQTTATTTMLPIVARTAIHSQMVSLDTLPSSSASEGRE